MKRKKKLVFYFEDIIFFGWNIVKFHKKIMYRGDGGEEKEEVGGGWGLYPLCRLYLCWRRLSNGIISQLNEII